MRTQGVDKEIAMPTKRLPSQPNLDHLKQQAKDLLRDRAAGDAQACQRLREFHPALAGLSDADIATANLTWSDGLFAIAREYGFASWPRLKARVEGPNPRDSANPYGRIDDADFRRAIQMMDDGDTSPLQTHLADTPGLATRRTSFEGVNYFRNPALLCFIAENPIRNDSLPPNAVEIATCLLEAGARTDPVAVNETLALTASGRVARESGQQVALIDLLCRYGADANCAMRPALSHGEMDAVRALLTRGANLTLPVAATLCDGPSAAQLLTAANADDRHLALALAAQHGCTDVVRLLLDAGESPDRYNPMGAHSHSTPLHHAALSGHMAIVRLLTEHGAKPIHKDALFQGTAIDWAEHNGHAAVAAYLKSPGH